jgi:ubiquinone/menaquinone biosynthesis C-methylase UbiE
MAMNCLIELLTPRLLENYPVLLDKIDDLRLSLGLDLGWHYPLDIIWMLEKIKFSAESAVILDAGAGKGLLQFALAEEGYQVVSVDFSNRRFQLPIRVVYPIQALKGDLSAGEYLDHINSRYSRELPAIMDILRSLRRVAHKARRFLVALVRSPFFLYRRRKRKGRVGSILIYQSNILNMPHIENGSIDAVVSLSVIEHLKKSEIEKAVREFQRVVKPGGLIIITTNAARDRDWYHEPSMGWCFSEQSIRDLFSLNQACPSNWGEYDTIYEQIRSSAELQGRLSPSLALSGKNGMPWGVWDPKYIPVGLLMHVP